MTCLEANFHTWRAATSLPSAIFILSCVTLKPRWKREFAILVRTSIHTRLRFFGSIFLLSSSSLLPFFPPPLTHFPPMSTQSPPHIRMSTNVPSQGMYHLFFFVTHHGSMAHRILSCVLVSSSQFHSPSFYNLHDRAFLPLRSFQFPFAARDQVFFHFFSPVAHSCGLCASRQSWTVDSFPWACSNSPP